MTRTAFHTASASREAPFDAVAQTYDETFTNSCIGRAQRGIITQELNRVFRAGQHILEINCGTGVDAVGLARRGVEVLACDISPRMVDVARRRADRARQESRMRAPATFRILATEEIGVLAREGFTARFDGAISNFAGLNCVEDLWTAARNLAALLKPGAPVLLCFFGRFCIWEVLWYLGHRNPAKAFRRFRPGGSLAQIGEDGLRVRYPSVHKLTRIFAPEFELKRWRGVGVTVPPTYLEPLARRFPKLLGTLSKLDGWLGRLPLVRGMADHVLLIFERRA